MVDLTKGLPLLNPKLPLAEADELRELTEMFPQADGVWIASSGSTGDLKSSLKLVALSRSALLSSARAVNQHLQVSSSDIWAQVLPEYHVGGLGIEIRAGLSGARVVKALQNEKWDPVYFLKLVEKQDITLASLVPTQVFDLLQLKRTPPKSLRAILVGGAALSSDLYSEARSAGWPVLPSYGMTEACSTVAAASLESLRGSPGKFPEFEILSHIEAELGSTSCLLVRGPSLLTGFARWTTEAGNRSLVWMDPKTSDGWYETEDICELTPKGLKVLGRKTEFLKILGEGVSLPKLETVLALILKSYGCSPQIATIVALAHPRDGWELQLVTEQALSAEQAHQIFESYNQKVMPFERLRSSRSVLQIPRTDLGKIKKSHLT